MSTEIIKIRNQYPQMNTTMKRIADYIISNPHEVMQKGAHELAGCSGVSDASVTRFVRYMGYENFKAFQLSFTASLSQEANGKVKESIGNRMQYSGEITGNNTEDVCRTIFSRSIQMLEDTWKNIDIAAIAKAVELIRTSKKILLLSVGRSKVTTEAFFSRLYRLGYNVQSFCDPHEQVIVTSMAQEGDLVIAVSNFGKTKSVVEGVIRARKRGAKTIGITSVTQSPLAREAEYTIFSAYDYEAGEMGKYYEPSCENVSQVTIADCIYMLLAMQDEDRIINAYEAISEELESEHIKS